jgi:hypothetical protein
MSFEANDTTLSEIVDLAWSRAEEKLDNVRARRKD